MVSETDHKDITIKRHDKMQNQRHMKTLSDDLQTKHLEKGKQK